MNKKEVRIENWYTTYYCGNQVLCGLPYGHSKLEDGKSIVTSKITNIDLKNNMIETKNTIYKLGKKSKYQIDGQISLEDIK